MLQKYPHLPVLLRKWPENSAKGEVHKHIFWHAWKRKKSYRNFQEQAWLQKLLIIFSSQFHTSFEIMGNSINRPPSLALRFSSYQSWTELAILFGEIETKNMKTFLMSENETDQEEKWARVSNTCRTHSVLLGILNEYVKGKENDCICHLHGINWHASFLIWHFRSYSRYISTPRRKIKLYYHFFCSCQKDVNC